LIMTIDDVEITAAVPVGAPRKERVDEAYPTRGVHARAVDRCNDLLIALEPAARKSLGYLLEVRAYDDGVAFRFLVPDRRGHAPPGVPDEATTLTLPAGSTVWSHDLRGHYEGQHEKQDVADVEAGSWTAPPLTYRLPEGAGYASITEARLIDYSG